MQLSLPGRLKIFFYEGHERSVKAKKNIAASFLIKGINIAIGLLLVPLTINYLNPTNYGIWITLSSIIGWFSFFDIGLGNGLRNKFAEALAKGDTELARVYVSTSYMAITCIIAVVLILFYIINNFLNWAAILKAGNDAGTIHDIGLLAIIVFTFFCLTFLFRLISTILTADQKPAKASLFNLITNILSLAAIVFLINTTQGSLLYLGMIFSGIPVLVFIIANYWFFTHEYKAYAPALRYVEMKKVKDIFSLGAKFFVIQISGVLIFQTNNIIISQLFGPAEVTPYNITFKYFNILMMFFAIVITPFWSAFTEAWVKKDVAWIKEIMHKLIKFWFTLVILGVVMLLAAGSVYEVWVGESIIIPFSLSVLVFTWIILNVWNGMFSHFLNGLGKISIQLYLGAAAAILNIPLAVFLGTKIGITGILLANIIVISFPLIIYPIQYKKLINGTAAGLWNK